MVTKNSKVVEFLGQRVSIGSDENGRLAEIALNLAKDRVNEMAKRHPNLSPHALSVLALLEMSGEMVKDRQKIDNYRRELDSRCQTLLKEIDSIAG